MAIKLITPLSTRWYERINVSTALISAVVVLMYLVFSFVVEPPGGIDSWGIYWPTAIAAAVHVAYSVAVFPFLEKSKPVLAGFLSYFLFAVMAGLLVHTSREQGTQYVGMWTIVVLLGGMFGWLVLSIVTLISFAYYWALASGNLSAPNDFNDAVIILIVLTSAVSFVLWRNVRKEPVEETTGNDKKFDITESLKSKALINSIIDGLVLIDAEGVIRVFNPAADQITGWSSKEATGLDYKSIFKFFDDKGQEYKGAENPIARCLATTQAVKEQSVNLKTNAGNTIELDLIASPVKEKEGQLMAVMVIFRDVSKERGEERQRAEFISTASHEMRTPVAAIEGYLALAMNDKVSKIDSNARSYLEKAHASTKHLGKLFQDLLTAAKSEDGRLTSHPVIIEVGVFLRDVTDRSRFSAEKKGLTVKYKISDQVIDTTQEAKGKVMEPIYYIHADPDRLREVITNLFDNAVKYTEEGQITIGMSNQENNIVISIADTGPGISKEDLPHLFQKFYRVDNSDTRQIGGTGLGLFISKKIVELYGGKIWVESEVQKGSTFYISLPQIPADKAKKMMRDEVINQSPLDETTSPLPTKTAPTEPQEEKVTMESAPPPAPVPQPIPTQEEAAKEVVEEQPATAPTPAPQAPPPQDNQTQEGDKPAAT